MVLAKDSARVTTKAKRQCGFRGESVSIVDARLRFGNRPARRESIHVGNVLREAVRLAFDTKRRRLHTWAQVWCNIGLLGSKLCFFTTG